MEPYVRIPKRIVDTDWFRGNTIKVFLWILCKAVLKDTNFMGITLHRGQFACSYRQIMNACGTSLQQTRNIVDNMVSTGLVTRSLCGQKQVFTIVSFDSYQGREQGLEQGYNTVCNRVPTQTQHPRINNKNNNINPEKVGWFETIWKMYPNNTHRKEAEEEFAKIDPDAELMSEIHDGLKRHLNSVVWDRENGRFIPRMDKWLAEKRWNDQVEQKPDPFGGYKDLDWNDDS